MRLFISFFLWSVIATELLAIGNPQKATKDPIFKEKRFLQLTHNEKNESRFIWEGTKVRYQTSFDKTGKAKVGILTSINLEDSSLTIDSEVISLDELTMIRGKATNRKKISRLEAGLLPGIFTLGGFGFVAFGVGALFGNSCYSGLIFLAASGIGVGLFLGGLLIAGITKVHPLSPGKKFNIEHEWKATPGTYVRK